MRVDATHQSRGFGRTRKNAAGMDVEWLFRLLTEPRRLWLRYLYRNPRFVVLAISQILRERTRRGPGTGSNLTSTPC